MCSRATRPTTNSGRSGAERGWVKEASHYLKLDRNVQCKICPNNCLLAPGDRSHCRNKVNRDGTLYTMAYGNPCTFHVDPVEKKPLFHFLPGSPAFSLATSGCVFRCLNCQNWEISQKKPEETKDPRGPELRLRPPLPPTLDYDELARLSLFPDDVVAVAKALRCPSIAYTYSEPTAYYEYAFDTCKLAREHGLKNIIVTCGSIEDRPLRDLLPYVDAAHVDLKGFSDDTYQRLNSGKLQPILNTLKTYHELGVWFEVINLVVPTYTDDLEMIKRMCGWLVENLGPGPAAALLALQPGAQARPPVAHPGGDPGAGPRGGARRRPALRLHRQRARGGRRRNDLLPRLQARDHRARCVLGHGLPPRRRANAVSAARPSPASGRPKGSGAGSLRPSLTPAGLRSAPSIPRLPRS